MSKQRRITVVSLALAVLILVSVLLLNMRTALAEVVQYDLSYSGTSLPGFQSIYAPTPTADANLNLKYS